MWVKPLDIQSPFGSQIVGRRGEETYEKERTDGSIRRGSIEESPISDFGSDLHFVFDDYECD